MRTIRLWLALALAAIGALSLAASAQAASPDSGTLSPDANGQGSTSWSGTVTAGDTTAGTTDDCFGDDKKPRDPTVSGCDFYKLDVTVPDGFYGNFIGGVQLDIDNFGTSDIDLGIYLRNSDGTRGSRVGGSGNIAGEPEQAVVPRAAGSYYVVAVPYTVPGAQTYDGKASFNVKKADPTLNQLNSNPALLGPKNYRASRDSYISHSEPTIAMDPLNHAHLIAGSKMYENLADYLFKIGTYESFDGGKTWKDYGFLPGYCAEPGQCDPSDTDNYRVTSDIAIAYDDEGNAYGDVLDAPGGAGSEGGWNNNVHIKRPNQPWTGPITVHDNRNNPISPHLLLDDKNWIAVDNYTTADGQPNKPQDGKVGTLYVCWSMDFDTAGQQIVLERSTDGGQTWGGFVPGDNTPYQISQRAVISGIGCHIAIGPQGEVYVTWYDNVLDQIMQAKSTNHGQSFTPARAIAQITGVNDPFEGQAFRNLSIPATAVDKAGNVYVSVMSENGEGGPVARDGSIEKPSGSLVEQAAEGSSTTGADIVLFKSTDGGSSYTGPVRVNQDKGDADQFQPWIAVTDKGQINISYFDRRNDANNFFIQTWLSRSNDGGKTFTDTPVGHLFWDPTVNPPISPSGEFIGDYQGLVADDNVAIPFWNDTQYANLRPSDRSYSPWQEVSAARIPNTKAYGGPGR